MTRMRPLAVLAGLLALALLPAAALGQKIAKLELEGKLRDHPGPFDWFAGGKPTLPSVISTLDEAAGDGEIAAVVLRLKDAELSRTQIEELGAELDLMKQAGKKVYLFAENY